MLVGLILVVWWTFYINSRLVIDFLTITDFTILLTYVELLSVSIVSLSLTNKEEGH